MATKKKTTTKTAAKKTSTKASTKKAAPKKTTAKKSMPKTGASARAKNPKTSTSHKKGQKPSKEMLHYDKEMVVEGYSNTYKYMMLATAVSVGLIFMYFMVFVVYLGGVSHTKHDPFYEKFSDRIDLSVGYEGKPLPQYEQKQNQ